MDEANRNHERAHVEVEITMWSENTFYTGLTDNISEGGIFVATHQPPAIGSEIELALSLPESSASYIVRGIVRWIRSFEASCEGMPPGCGVQWIDLPEHALATISEFVRERGTLYYEDAA